MVNINYSIKRYKTSYIKLNKGLFTDLKIRLVESLNRKWYFLHTTFGPSIAFDLKKNTEFRVRDLFNQLKQHVGRMKFLDPV